VLALDQNIWFGIAAVYCWRVARPVDCWVRRSNSARKIELAENAGPALLRKLKGTRAQSKRGRDTGQGQSHKRKNGFREGGCERPGEKFKRSKSDWSAKKKLWISGSIRYEKRDSDLGRREAAIKSREKSIEDKSVECVRQVDEARKQFEQVAGMTREEAKRNLIDQMVEEAKHDSGQTDSSVEEGAKEERFARAKKYRFKPSRGSPGDFVAERSVTVVALPNDELKGKIIGERDVT